MKKVLTGIVTAGIAASLFASEARIETMGGTDHFIRDAHNMYTNPATISQYGRYLHGDLGIYIDRDTSSTENLSLENKEPEKPYFGGNYYFGEEENGAGFYLGATFNREDRLLKYLVPGNKEFMWGPTSVTGSSLQNVSYLNDVVGKIDILAGYKLANGTTIGLGGYLAFQDSTSGTTSGAKTRLAKGTVGINSKVSKEVELDASVGISALTLQGVATTLDNVNGLTLDNDIAITIDARVFAKAGEYREFIPHIQANILNYEDDKMVDFNAGLAMSSIIDRGFFWAGLEGVFSNNPRSVLLTDTIGSGDSQIVVPSQYGKENIYGGRVSFGIERNMLTDWLVWRVGATHSLLKSSLEDGDKGEWFKENDSNTKISFGLGVNIEDRLRVDAVISENIFYTFSNLISGNMDHLVARISAGFEF